MQLWYLSQSTSNDAKCDRQAVGEWRLGGDVGHDVLIAVTIRRPNSFTVERILPQKALNTEQIRSENFGA